MRRLNLINSVFGRLTVVEKAKSNGGNLRWLCKCECGSTKEVRGNHLTGGKIRSCGCLLKESRLKSSVTHGMAGSATFKSWSSMKERCLNENSKSYSAYGAKGITVCERWMSFENFHEDMGVRPKGTSIDRIDGGIGYSPENCRWATPFQQVINRRFKKSQQGVYEVKTGFISVIGVNYKVIHLGTFKTYEEAVMARKEAEEKHWLVQRQSLPAQVWHFGGEEL